MAPFGTFQLDSQRHFQRGKQHLHLPPKAFVGVPTATQLSRIVEPPLRA